MSVLDKAAEFIADFEGLRLEAYQDVANIWTIGVGATGPGIGPKTVWTKEQALNRFKDDLKDRYAQLVRILGDSPATEDQAVAMLSLLYNIGAGNFRTSSVLKEHKAKQYDRAGNAFLLWNKAGGKIIGGLIRRRKAERALYLGEA